MTSTIVVAIAGIVGTLAGTVVGPYATARFSERREHQARLRDARMALYLDINTSARSVAKHLDFVIDLQAAGELRQIPTQPGWATLDARIELLATDEVKEAFHSMHHAHGLVTRKLQEVSSKPATKLEPGDPSVVAARSAVKRMYELTRAAVEQA
ncbi:hypothetical protein ACFFX1_14540 [Dactylosporangium sucinum]|uniref:hypothetical protein n=1 Tax=Dactylosporangium sucinum TaxID=1424081 RepID=UPI00167C77FE|nr:hypothetical protein [Dactylosporangium sucinum]